jgi:hypothetical protein
MIFHIRVEMANMTISGRDRDGVSEIADALDGLSCIRDRRSSLETCLEGSQERSGDRLPARLAPVTDSVLEACLAASCPLAEEVEKSGLNCSGVLLPGCAAVQPVRLAMMRRFRERGYNVGIVRFFLPASKRAQALPKCMQAHREELRGCVEAAAVPPLSTCAAALCPVSELFPSLDCRRSPELCLEVGHAGGELARDYADAGYPAEISDYLPTGFIGDEADKLLRCFAAHRDQLKTCTELRAA